MATVDITDWDEKNTASVGNLSDSSSFSGLQKVQPVKISEGTGSGTGDAQFSSSTWSNISSQDDIVVTESDESTTRPYEIESLDTTNNVAWIWVYGSWNSDDSDQIVIGAGGGDGTDYSSGGTGSNPWGQTGQNTDLAYHFEESSGTITDSTSNNNDSSSQTVTSYGVQSAPGEAVDLDSTDDNIQSSVSSDLSEKTWSLVIEPDISNTNSNTFRFVQTDEDAGFGLQEFSFGFDTANEIAYLVGDGGSLVGPSLSLTFDAGDKLLLVGRYQDNDNVYLDAFNLTDGNSVNNSVSIGTSGNPSQTFYMNANRNLNNHPGGNYTEFRQHSEKKSDNWVIAEKDGIQKVFFSWSGPTTTSTAVTATVTDSLTFNETTDTVLQATLSDSIGFTENQLTTLKDVLTDSIGFTENTKTTLSDKLTDQLNLSENTASKLLDTVEDQLTLQDQVLFGAIAVTQSDSLTFGENIDSQISDTIQEQLQIQENILSTLEPENLSDQLNFTENVQAVLTEILQDQLSFDENVAATISDTLTDQLSLTEQTVFASLLTVNAPSKAIITNKNRFAVMENHTFTEGDLADELSATLEDQDGAIDLTQAKRVELDVKDRNGNVKFNNKTINIDNASQGKVTYSWQQGDFIEDEPGVYRAKFRIIDNNDEPESVPNDGFITIEVESEID